MACLVTNMMMVGRQRMPIMKISKLVASSRSLHRTTVAFNTGPSDKLPAKNNGTDTSLKDDVTDMLDNVKKQKFEKLVHPEKLHHFKYPSSHKSSGEGDQTKKDENWVFPHPIWNENELTSVKITHLPPEGVVDILALGSVRGLRILFDRLSGFSRKERSERIWVNRITFLETLAAVPGMVGAMMRHLQSLRRMRRDHGWIHTLIEEAENERLHLLTALQIRQPSLFFRMCVAAAQGTFLPFFSVAYLISPRYCHRFVGYLEEEAVITYTKCLQDMECGPISHWKTTPAPAVAISYWQLPNNATLQDVIYNIRADEAHHRIVNHTLGSMRPDDYNPYKPGE